MHCDWHQKFTFLRRKICRTMYYVILTLICPCITIVIDCFVLRNNKNYFSIHRNKNNCFGVGGLGLFWFLPLSPPPLFFFCIIKAEFGHLNFCQLISLHKKIHYLLMLKLKLSHQRFWLLYSFGEYKE